MAKKKSAGKSLLLVELEVNKENHAEICKLEILSSKLLARIHQVLALGQFSTVSVLVHGNPGVVIWREWVDLWVEEVFLLCAAVEDTSSGYRFTIRQRFFYQSIYERERRVSDLLPSEPFFYRHYLWNHEPPHHEGLCWFGASKSVDEHVSRYEAAQAILKILGAPDYESLRRRYFETLDKYIGDHPNDSEIVKTKFVQILYRGASRSQLYRNDEKAPFLWEEIDREFRRRKNQ